MHTSDCEGRGYMKKKMGFLNHESIHEEMLLLFFNGRNGNGRNNSDDGNERD